MFWANLTPVPLQYLSAEPVKSGGHVALLEGDPSVGEVTCLTGKAGDAMLFHGLTLHVNSTSRAGGTQPRVAQFARYACALSVLCSLAVVAWSLAVCIFKMPFCLCAHEMPVCALSRGGGLRAVLV